MIVTDRIKNALKACEKLHARPITAELFARHYKPVMPHNGAKRITVVSAMALLRELHSAGYLIKVSRGKYMLTEFQIVRIIDTSTLENGEQNG